MIYDIFCKHQSLHMLPYLPKDLYAIVFFSFQHHSLIVYCNVSLYFY